MQRDVCSEASNNGSVYRILWWFITCINSTHPCIRLFRLCIRPVPHLFIFLSPQMVILHVPVHVLVVLMSLLVFRPCFHPLTHLCIFLSPYIHRCTHPWMSLLRPCIYPLAHLFNFSSPLMRLCTCPRIPSMCSEPSNDAMSMETFSIKFAKISESWWNF